MLVDLFARSHNRQPELVLRMFFGQLQHIYVVHFTQNCPALNLHGPTTIIMVAIQTCKVDAHVKIPHLPHFHFYSELGATHVLDVTCLQSVVARVANPHNDHTWTISDRSGDLVLASYSDS